MYREIIEEVTKENKWVKIQEGCSKNDIINAENFIGHTFPHELKTLLFEMNGDNYFLLSTGQMMERVKINREILAEYIDDEYREKVEPFIYFATNGCGDYYCYKVMENGEIDRSAIYIWEHETFEAKPVADDLKDAIIKYYNCEI